MADTGGYRNPRNRAGWRHLGLFWLAVLTLTAAGAGTVQWLGPPVGIKRTAPPRQASIPLPVQTAARIAEPPILIARAQSAIQPVVGRDTPGPVADPDPALLEPVSEGSPENLPRIASDGRTSMQVYAAGFDHSSRRPRVACCWPESVLTKPRARSRSALCQAPCRSRYRPMP